MCVIVYKPAGVKLSIPQLHKMWDRNPHGMGFVGRIKKGEKWTHKKGVMERDEAIQILSEYIGKESDLLFHFRILSRGKLSPEMTHPFEWSNTKEKRFIFHNGTVTILSGGCDSDSSILSQILTPVQTDRAYKILLNLAKKDYGRFATFVHPKDEEPEIKVFDGKESVWKEGVWYSNVIHETFVAKVEKPKHSQGGHTLALPAPKSVHCNIRVKTEDDENLEKIVDFYVKKCKLSDNERNRSFITEAYSLNMMCPRFLDDIAQEIDKETSEDPINSYFES